MHALFWPKHSLNSLIWKDYFWGYLRLQPRPARAPGEAIRRRA